MLKLPSSLTLPALDCQIMGKLEDHADSKHLQDLMLILLRTTGATPAEGYIPPHQADLLNDLMNFDPDLEEPIDLDLEQWPINGPEEDWENEILPEGSYFRLDPELLRPPPLIINLPSLDFWNY